MEAGEKQKKYELLFQGVKDSLADTLRKVKTAFVVDLNFSIEETKQIIESAPATILRTDDKDEITKYQSILGKAGADLFLVEIPDDTEDKSTASLLKEDNFHTKDDLQRSDKGQVSIEDEVEVMEFEVDLDSAIKSKHPQAPSKVYEIPEVQDVNSPVIPTSVIDAKAKMDPAPPTPKEELLYSFEEISKALEESQKNGEPATDAKTQVPIEDDDFKLTFSDEVPDDLADKKVQVEKQTAKPSIRPKKQSIYATEPKSQPQSSSSNDTALMFEVDVAQKPQGTKADKTSDLTLKDSTSHNKEVTQLNNEAVDKASSTKSLVSPGIFTPSNTAFSSPKQTSPVPFEDQVEAVDIQEAHSRSALREILLPTVVLLALMAAANWYYFSQKGQSNSDTGLNNAKMQLIHEDKLDKDIKEARKITENPKISLQGEANYPNRKIVATFNIQKDGVKSLSIEMTTLRPPALSPEQIVQQEKQKPWLTKLVIDNIPITSAEDGYLAVQGAAKAYIQNDKDTIRVIGTAKLEGSWSWKEAKVQAKIKVFYNTDQADYNAENFIKRNEDSSISFFYSGEITAQKGS